MLLVALNLNAQKTANQNPDFQSFWENITISLGDNAKGNNDPKDVAKNVLFPLKIENKGIIKDIDKKSFIKNFNRLFSFSSYLSIMDLNKFIEISDISNLKLNTKIDPPYFKTDVIDLDGKKLGFTVYFGKVANKFNIIYILEN